MPENIVEVTHSPDADVGANTSIDLSNVLPGPMDVRGGNDPIAGGALKAGAEDTSATGTTVLETTTLTSQGQGAAGDPAAGEVVATGPYSIALGDALDNNSLVRLEVELRGGENIVL